jgi:GDPmannose 4,6-dehydratase
MKKKAIIFGITGQDGSYLAEILISKGYKVYGIVRKSATGNLENIIHLVDNKKVFNKQLFLLKGDLLDVNSIYRVITDVKPDEIYNEADQDHVGWSYDIPSYSMDITSSSVVKILEAIKAIKPDIKYFQPCSSNMFGITKTKYLNEDSAFNPQSIYAIGKVSAFHTVNYYRNTFNLYCSAGIFFNHESPRRQTEYVSRKITNTVAKIYYKKINELSLGDTSAIIDWGYAKEYMEAAYKILQLNQSQNFIIGTGYSYSVNEFMEEAFNYVGLNSNNYLKINKKLIRPSKTSPLLADNKKAKKIIKFNPKIFGKKLVHKMMEHDLKIEKA